MGFSNLFAKTIINQPRLSLLPIRLFMLSLLSLGLVSCQLDIVQTTQESATNVITGIRNLPSTILPSQFESTAYVDRDFRIPNASMEVDGQYTIIRTFFATNRTADSEAAAAQMFGDGRSDVVFGKSYVTLKRSADTFDIEPESLVKLDIVEEPEAPVSLSQNEILDADDIANEINSVIEDTENGDLLFYVHGFNTGFAEAATRSAQLSYDLGFAGTTVFYSWPARGSTAAYVADSENASRSQRQLEMSLSQVIGATMAKRVYLVAQGMGARLASRALKSIFLTQPALRSRVKEIILIAPDIETEEFTVDLAPFLGSSSSPVTLYAASNNEALAASQSLNHQPLVGENKDGVLIVSGVETIDAGTTDTSLVSHASYTSPDSIVGDIWYLVRYGIRANSRRPLRAMYTDAGTYWEYNP